MSRVESKISDHTRYSFIHQRNILEEILYYAKKLNIKERIMIYIRFRDGYKYNEIAAAFRINESTASRKIKRFARN